MNKIFFKRSLLIQVLPWLALVLMLKYGAHALGWEFIELNTLFTAVISANVFLLGFLLAGVLTDYKESERLPSELTSNIDSIIDESLSLYKTKKIPEAKGLLEYVKDFSTSLDAWFHKKERTHIMMGKIRGMSDFFAAFEPHTQANFIVRLKQDQSNIRRIMLRIDTIRDTSFVTSGYRIAEINSMLLIIGMIFLSLDLFSNVLFYTFIITLLFLYMLRLIKDLDNPFGFYEAKASENVEVKVLKDTRNQLDEVLKKL